MSQNLDTLLTVAAELRAAGHSWNHIAKQLNRKTKTCQNWPAKYRDQWESICRVVQQRRFEQTAGECHTHLVGLTRDKDPKVRAKGLELFYKYGGGAYGKNGSMAVPDPPGGRPTSPNAKILDRMLDAMDYDRRRLDQKRAVKGLPPLTDDAFMWAWGGPDGSAFDRTCVWPDGTDGRPAPPDGGRTDGQSVPPESVSSGPARDEPRETDWQSVLPGGGTDLQAAPQRAAADGITILSGMLLSALLVVGAFVLGQRGAGPAPVRSEIAAPVRTPWPAQTSDAFIDGQCPPSPVQRILTPFPPTGSGASLAAPGHQLFEDSPMRLHLRPIGPAIVLFGIIAVASRDDSAVKAQSKAAPVAVAPQSPTIAVPFPLGAQRGQALELALTGTNLAEPTALWTSFPCKVSFPTDKNNGKEPTKLRVKLEIPADAPIGMHSIRLATKHGISNTRIFCVDELPQLTEAADNHSVSKAQPVPVPCVIAGRTDAEISDFFKVTLKPGQRMTFDVIGHRLGSQLDPVIKLYDAKTGRELPGHYSDDEPGLQSDARLTQTFPNGGDFVVEVRDTRYQGGAEYYYRLRIADVPAAMTAFPVAVQHGAKATIQFTGKHVEGVAPVEVTMPLDRTVVNVAPKGQGLSGWPVPVYASDMDELVEQEPNNEPAKANRLHVPCGITARFLEKGDVDYFVFTAKKGVKYAIVAETYDILSPAEVYLIVKDKKGADLAKSNPQNTPARIDFTARADGDFLIYAEHLNYASGPTEVYHLTLKEDAPDFEVQLPLDRFPVAAGETTLIPVAQAVRHNFTGPIELSVIGHPGFSGKVTLPNGPVPKVAAGQPVPPAVFLPLSCKADMKPGAYEIRVIAKATVNGKDVRRFASVGNAVKAELNGLAFPPHEMLTSVGVAVTDKPLFSLALKLSNPEALRGVATNVTVTARRAAGFADEIQLAPLTVPPNVAIAAKPIPKGKDAIEFPITVAANGPLGALPLTFRGTTKTGGKDYAYYSSEATLNVVTPVEVKATPSPLTLKIGQKAKLAVTITRKGGYKGPVNLEVKNLPANVSATKATIAADKTAGEIELTAGPKAAAADKPDVQVTATATAAANQVATSPNVVLKVVK